MKHVTKIALFTFNFFKRSWKLMLIDKMLIENCIYFFLSGKNREQLIVCCSLFMPDWMVKIISEEHTVRFLIAELIMQTWLARAFKSKPAALPDPNLMSFLFFVCCLYGQYIFLWRILSHLTGKPVKVNGCTIVALWLPEFWGGLK